MLRILRAFAWLRWRILVNSLERSTSRDLVERFSLGLEQLAPLVLLFLMVPSALALAGVSATAGWTLAHGAPEHPAWIAVRLLLHGAVALALIGPLLFPAGAQLPGARLRLLPIPQSTAYLARMFAALADPWILLPLAVLLALPAGLAAGAAPAGVAVAAGAGALLFGVLLGLHALVSGVLQLVLRDRRRSEIVAVAGMLLLAALPLAATFGGARTPATQIATAAAYGLPSSWYASAVGAAAARTPGSLPPLAALGAALVAVHAAAFVLFLESWRSPAESSGRAAAGPRRGYQLRVPGLSAAASAVALAQIRLALRTPRGRSMLLSPLVIFGVVALMLARMPSGVELAGLRFSGGLSLAVLGSAIALLGVLPFAVNQFAVDRAGLTLLLLAPIRTRALLAGKTAGNGVVAALPALVCLAAAAVLYPSGSPALWLCVPLGFTATYLLVAPAAAALSAIFPKAVDLGSGGSGSNPHGAASLAGLAITAAAGTPPVLLALFASRGLGRAEVALALLTAWCAVCLIACIALLRVAERVYEARRENLALMRSTAR